MNIANSAGQYDDRREFNFVASVAWVFIVVVAITGLISLFHNILVGLVFPFNEVHTAMAKAGKIRAMPWFAQFMQDYFTLLSVMFFVFAAAVLVTAIGLLQRRNWARQAFIGIMVFGIVWNGVRLALPLLMYFTITSITGSASADFGYQFDIIQKIMIGFSVLIAIGTSVLFAWIALRLSRDEFKREFADSGVRDRRIERATSTPQGLRTN